jgi:hypothetical protein
MLMMIKVDHILDGQLFNLANEVSIVTIHLWMTG